MGAAYSLTTVVCTVFNPDIPEINVGFNGFNGLGEILPGPL